ncbi:MAG: IMP cyclohydrolase [Sphaerochaeta sp.]|nr:IMP cyclohydrolase [Sphaerochaeta sp.]
MNELETLLQGNRYPGRGILVGQTEEGEPLFAYFIMGRSAQSRNRVFRAEGPDLFTRPYDPALVSDPSLIIYRAVASVGPRCGGDQRGSDGHHRPGAGGGFVVF